LAHGSGGPSQRPSTTPPLLPSPATWLLSFLYAALRKVALGRKNFLFVGHQAAGENLAGLYALVATCEANGVNPEQYLAYVLLRVQTHPNSRIDELLPHRWQPQPDVAAAA